MKKARNILLYTFAALGFILSALLMVGLSIDFGNFDQTSGGYEPPYTDYTGEPVDFDAGYQTEEGIYGPGWVWSSEVNCTTGMVTFHFFNNFEMEWREVSPRAIAIHEPHEACERRGFDPQFGPQASGTSPNTSSNASPSALPTALQKGPGAKS
ncbi:MAG: hypothetical protein ACFB50_18455 [Rubrobacteraceae bacterium]